MRKRWVVRCRDRAGKLIGEEERFWLRRSAVNRASWHRMTATGTHLFTTPLPVEMGPLFTVEVVPA